MVNRGGGYSPGRKYLDRDQSIEIDRSIRKRSIRNRSIDRSIRPPILRFPTASKNVCCSYKILSYFEHCWPIVGGGGGAWDPTHGGGALGVSPRPRRVGSSPPTRFDQKCSKYERIYMNSIRFLRRWEISKSAAGSIDSSGPRSSTSASVVNVGASLFILIRPPYVKMAAG